MAKNSQKVGDITASVTGDVNKMDVYKCVAYEGSRKKVKKSWYAKKSWWAIILSAIALWVSVITFMSLSIWRVDAEYLTGVVLSIFALIVAILLGWQIRDAITFDKKIRHVEAIKDELTQIISNEVGKLSAQINNSRIAAYSYSANLLADVEHPGRKDNLSRYISAIEFVKQLRGADRQSEIDRAFISEQLLRALNILTDDCEADPEFYRRNRADIHFLLSNVSPETYDNYKWMLNYTY